jgi:hypothetical protein
MESFCSAVSEVKPNEEASDASVLGDDSLAIDSFCLDIDKLEKVLTKTNKGILCRVSRVPNFAKATHFLLRANFVDGTKWDIIIPYPDQLNGSPKQASNGALTATESIQMEADTPVVPNHAPILYGWRASSDNDAGVAYFFVNSISGTNINELN